MDKELEKLVILESPLRSKNKFETSVNVLYARACARDSLLKEEYPYAPQLVYTLKGIINPKNKEELKWMAEGINSWESQAKKRVFYIDREFSQDMNIGLKNSSLLKQEVELRKLPNYEGFLTNASKHAEKRIEEFDYNFGEKLKKVWNSEIKNKENRIILESPFRGKNYSETEINKIYARACARECFLQGKFPFVSHLYYTQDGILNDKIENERNLGINAGIMWGTLGKERNVFDDREISRGMDFGIAAGKKMGQILIYQSFPDYHKFLEEIEKLNLKKGYQFKRYNENFSKKNN